MHYIGIDVHKRKCVTTIKGDAKKVLKRTSFDNDITGINGFIGMLRSDGYLPATAACESTGNYWIVLHDTLEAAGIHIEGLNKWKTMIQAAAKSAIRPIPFVVPPILQPIPAHEYVTVPLPPVTIIPALSAGASPSQAFTSTINLPPTATIQTRLWAQVDNWHERLRL